jgi:MSHA pilin protein MshD
MRFSHTNRGFTLIETIIFIIIVGTALAGVIFLYLMNAKHSHQPLIRQKAIAVASAYMDEILGKRWDENTPLGGGCVITPSLSCETVWTVATAYATDGVVVPSTSNGHKYRALNAGTSSAIEPGWPTDGSSITDGSIIWQDLGDFTVSSNCGTTPSNCGPDGTETRDDYDDIDDFNGLSDSPPQFPDKTAVDGDSPMPGYDGYSVSVTVTSLAWNGVVADDTRRVEVTVSTPMNESFQLVAYRLNL